MKSFALFIVFPILWASQSGLALPHLSNATTLRLVHVIFRHGDRNPDSASLIPNSPYYNESYYPEGFGQLTKAGKRKQYRMGLRLRQLYNTFLTDTWNINYLEARSTNVNRTKMSLELVLAGLYPPKKQQVWSHLPWQPIPYNYPSSGDQETQPWVVCGTSFKALLTELLASDEIVAYEKRYKELLSILENRTGLPNLTLNDAFNYYFGFATQLEIGYTLESWTSQIFPEPLHSAAVDYYYYVTNNTAIRRLSAGFLIRKILADTKAKINGTLSPSSRKLFLYSGHELNIASTLLTLDAYKLTDIPPYGSHIIFEVHEISGVWGIKLFYQNYLEYDPILLTIPGCDYFCPYDEFYRLVEEILPLPDTECLQ
ncbi:venom acid phosphatase Acph-1-like [Euwallacea fornicatus]|uniref:venom acid phosphatase Acph-1-like n=1 Tax=Euwallacea fornicatus TaxID=995702 RepID=UPI00338E8B62